MDELDQFEVLVVNALGDVDQSYYETVIRNLHAFMNAAEISQNFKTRLGVFRNGNFHRYCERVFCYEFYHQLRLQVDSERSNNNRNFLAGAVLQAEVEKMNILRLIEKFGLKALSGEYTPDLLMHSPGNADRHPFVLEVKCDDRLSASKIFNDLLKLSEFITKFRYQRGLFIAINADQYHIQGSLKDLNKDIEKLEGRDRIKVISKQHQNAIPKIWQL